MGDQMSDKPFDNIPFDGIMGLGFKDLSMGEGFNIVDVLSCKGAVSGPGGGSVFSFYISDSDDSEVTFGGYRPERLASDIVWAPVQVQSWWQVGIEDITFNNQPQNLCGGMCQVAVDTGTSMLAGPTDLVDKLSRMLRARQDCSNFDRLPNIGFQIGAAVLNLRPGDYMDRSSSGCSMSIMGLDVPPPKGPVFIFGDPFLRRFVTIYDRSKPAVGFAVAKRDGDSSTSGLIAHIDGHGTIRGSAAEKSNPSAVNLHLHSGYMTGSGGGSFVDFADGQPQRPTGPKAFERESKGKSPLPMMEKGEDAALEMRRLLQDGFFIQNASPQNGGLVSVKLHRNSGPQSTSLMLQARPFNDSRGPEA